MMETPHDPKVRVTIGLPVFNGENFLDQGIKSILSQTYEAFELIISDNGSIDSTSEIARNHAASDSRIRYVRSETNRGAGWNYENVRSLARGSDFFKWSAHDDLIAPTFLERCIDALDEHPEATLAFSAVAAIDESGNVTRLKKRQVEAVGSDPHKRFRQVLITDANPEAVYGVMRRSALAHSRGQGDYVASDRVLLAELALQGPFVEVPEVLLFNRDHPNRSVRITKGEFRLLGPWFAPEKPEQFAPYWRLWREYAHAAVHAPLLPAERLRCMLQLPWFVPRHLGRLLGDISFAARRVSRPWKQPSGGIAVGAMDSKQ